MTIFLATREMTSSLEVQATISSAEIWVLIADGESGDDVIYYQGDDTVRGGAGTDTLALQDWRQAAINLHTGRFSGIESIDLRNSPNFDVAVVDTLTVDITKIPQVSDNDSLIVRADSSDKVTLLGSPTRAADVTFDTERFAQFTNGQTKLYVLLGTSVNGTALLGLSSGAKGKLRLLSTTQWMSLETKS